MTPDQLSAELAELEGLPRADPDGAARRAVEAAAAARVLDLPELERRAEVVRADVLERQGAVGEAGRIAQAVLAWAVEHADRYLQARCHHVLEMVFSDLGDVALALEHAVLAVELLDDQGSAAVRIDHLLRLADCAGVIGDHEAARARFPAVLRLAEDAGDVDRQLLVLNNWAYAEALAEENVEALRLSRELQAHAARYGRALHISQLDTVARALINLGRWEEAEAVLHEASRLGLLTSTPEADVLAVTLLTMAAVQRARGHVDTAQETLDLCLRTCAENGLAGLRVQAREEQAELHAAAGRYREAYEEYRLFHIETTELRSRERDARARVLQAMYETGEARRQVREYRELSQRDALTGLYNRRRVEEEVPRLLRTGADRRHVVTVALLDLDHFKRVNDTCSHDVGDQVLCAVADLLESAVASVSGTGSFTARMGGEEFLLVLVTADVPTAAHRLEEIRRAVQHHPWDGLTEGLPVTVSIGAVSIGPDVATPTLGQLLGQADAHLYVAKSQGRNRVVSDAD